MAKPLFSMSELNALRTFAAFHGRSWRTRLRDCWAVSGYPGMPESLWPTLQGLRNREGFGPAGLTSFRFPAPETDLYTVEILMVRRLAVNAADDIQAEKEALLTMSDAEREKAVCMRVYEGPAKSDVDWPDVGDGWYSPPPS